MTKKLAKLYMDYGRIITCYVHTETDTYYDVQIIEVKNPIKKGDWQMNDKVKISKSLINKVEWKS